MQDHIDQALREHFGDKWLDYILEDEKFVKTLKGPELDTLKHLPRHVEKGEAKPAERFEPTHFMTLVRVYKDAFPPRLYTHRRSLEVVRDSRNFIKHQSYLSDRVTAQDYLSTYRAVLDYIEDYAAVNAIEELLNQLNDLDSEGGADLAEQDGEPHNAQSDDAPNAAPRVEGEEPPDAPSEDGGGLAEQDGEPPARRTEGGGLRRRWLYVFGAGVLTIAVIAAALGSRSGNGSPNGQPVCSDIGDVELAGPRGSIELAALGDYCADPGEDELTFSAASSDNDIVSATVAGDLLTLIAGDGDGGTATITVTATDPDGRSATASFDVTVNPSPSLAVVTANQPPDCDDVEGVTIVEGETQEVSIFCSDRDGDTVMLRVSDDSQTGHHSVSPDTASIDGSGARQFSITGLSSSAGTSYVEIEADDGKGGTDTVRFNVVVEDGGGEPPPVVPPQIEGSISCAPSPVAVNASVECRANVSGTPPFTYEWRGGSSSNTASASYNASFNAEGSQSVSLTVSNVAGSDDGTTTVQVMTPPSIGSLGCPSSATVKQAVNCSPIVSGTGPLTYMWSGSDSSGSTSSSIHSPRWSTPGRKTISLTVRNAVGSDSGSSTVEVPEPPPPQIGNGRGSGTTTVLPPRPLINSISCMPSPVAVNENVSCTVNLSGGTPTSYLWSGGSPWNRTDDNYSTSFSAEGRHFVSLTVSNDGGRDAGSTTVQVMTPPSVNSISCSPFETGTGSSIKCSASVSGTGPLAYVWSGGDSSGSSPSYSPSWNTPGAKTIQLSLRNDVGSHSSSTAVSVIEPPRINSISCSPSPVDTDERTECSVSVSVSGVEYSWSASGDAFPPSDSGSTYRPQWSSPGTKNVSLDVRNLAGSDSASTPVTVKVKPPDIVISCTAYVVQGASVHCTANNYGGRISTYMWSDSDGSSGSSESYSISFSSYGPHVVRLTASNDGGSDSDSHPVDVLATPPSTALARCGSDATNVYYFETASYTKHQLRLGAAPNRDAWADTDADDALSAPALSAPALSDAWSGDERIIAIFSQAACDSWPTGNDLIVSD